MNENEEQESQDDLQEESKEEIKDVPEGEKEYMEESTLSVVDTSTENNEVAAEEKPVEKDAPKTRVLTEEDVQREVRRLLAEEKQAEQAAKELHSAKIEKLKELGITQNADAIANTYSDVDTLEANIRAVRANILREGETGNVKDNSHLPFEQKVQQTVRDFRSGGLLTKKQ